MTDTIHPQVGVGVVVINDKEEVLLIQRGEEPNKGKWSIPGGKQDPGETLHQTAHREVEEETGVLISTPTLIDVVDLIRHDDDGSLLRHYALIDYAALYVSGVPRPGGDAAAVKWVPVDSIADHVEWSETIRIVQAGAAKLASTNSVPED